MKKAVTGLSSLIAASALLLGGCAQPPSASTTASSSGSASGSAVATSDFKACMVSDDGGFDDKSFNETAHNGMMKAVQELGLKTNQIESHAQSEFAGNVQAMINDKCNIIITVGFLLAQATQAAAEQNPNVNFAIVDYPSFDGVKNAKGLVFNAAQPAFLAGYVAASQTKTGTVGTFGGKKIPTVTIFMDGFAEGVAYYNKQKGTSVKVIGWDTTKRDGQFIDGNNAFGDIPGGKNTANTLISQGADIILPVAGPAGEGALQAAKESNGKVKAIWVDSDGALAKSNYSDVIITSVMKGMDAAVFDAIKAAKDGKFSSGPYVGTFANGGVSLAPFHNFDSQVSAETKKELEQIKSDIASGKITIASPDQPKS